MNVNVYIKEFRRDNNITPKIQCQDGFNMSVQASQYHYCNPRSNAGPYTTVEVGFPSEVEPMLMDYAETPSEPTDTVYPNVPVNLVEQVIAKHGGMVS